MINPGLFGKAAAIDTQLHRDLRIAPTPMDWAVASRINSMFVASVEFGDVCPEYPIVFVEAGPGPDGKQQVAPIAVFGLQEAENLYVEEGRWRAQYLPALLRAYPFGIARLDDTRVAVVIDEAWAGWSRSEGEPLFQADGQPAAHLAAMRDHLEKVEAEVQRTRLFGQMLLDAGLLTGMRFEATVADGQKFSVDGFLAVDEKAFAALSDERVLQLHKSGALALVHAHQISLRHMRRLVEWKQQRALAKAGDQPAASSGSPT